MAKPKSSESSEHAAEITADHVIDWLLAEYNRSLGSLMDMNERAYGSRVTNLRADRSFAGVLFLSRPMSWRLSREELFAAVRKKATDAAKEKLLR